MDSGEDKGILAPPKDSVFCEPPQRTVSFADPSKGHNPKNGHIESKKKVEKEPLGIILNKKWKTSNS
jgi:hypothetical protein